MKVLIITGGKVKSDLLKEYLKSHSYDYIIAADGGGSYAKEVGIRPDLLLGDFDTLDKQVLKEYQEMGVEFMTFPPEKDYTDTHLALTTALAKNPEQITIFGATGTRLDHTLANIGLLTLAVHANVKAELIDENNRIQMMKDHLTIKKEEAWGNYISLLAYTEKVAGIDLEGFLYPLHKAELTIGISRGISNELVKEQGTISIESGLLLVIESRD